jgi:hypothetical protein
MSAPYVIIPKAVFDGVDTGVITAEQFDVLAYCYWRAERPEYVVRGFSAANVCRFRSLDATKANLKKYQRAAADLLNLWLIRRDYHRIDPRRADQHARPYNVWIPIPARFGVIGAAEQNRVSFFVSSNVAVVVADNVALLPAANNCIETTSENSECDNVAVDVALIGHSLSFSNQEKLKSIEKYPLNLPPGDFSPAPLPPRGDAQAAGLLTLAPPSAPADKGRPLDVRQCESLKKAALLYADFNSWLYGGFFPDVNHVEKLLRHFTPSEILFSQINRFEPLGSFAKKDMAHFFWKSAKDSIEAGRIKGTSKTKPDWVMRAEKGEKGTQYIKDFYQRWKIVNASWWEVYPAVSPDAEKRKQNSDESTS